MPLEAREHQRVKRATRQTRASGARAWRGNAAGKLGQVTLLDATLPDGTPILIALTPADPARGYVLRREDGRWRCGCFNAVHSVARTCGHEAAANRSGAHHA